MMSPRDNETVIGAPGPVDVLEISAGATIGGAYRVKKKLGVGAMGVVYLAEDIQLGRPVAVKFLNPFISDSTERVDLFREEAKALARLNHSNVVQVYTFGEERGYQFFAMEFLVGKTLAERIEDRRRYTPKEAGSLLMQIGEALEAAHRVGIIHRDLKPANIVVDDAGRVKVMDFGLAGIAADSAGRTVGTPRYMSPEQALGHRVDPRTDIYSMGIIAYELLVGDVPFEGENYRRTLELQVTAPVPSPRKRRSDIPFQWDKLIMEMLAKRPEDRPISAREVTKRIRFLLRPPEHFVEKPKVQVDRSKKGRSKGELDNIYEKARAHFDIREFDKAREYINDLIKAHPKEARAHNLLGAVNMETGDFIGAAKAFAAAVAANPNSVEAHINLGIALERQGRFQEGIWAFEQATRLAPSHEKAQVHLGEARLAVRDLPGALKAWERAVALNPSNSTLRERIKQVRRAMAL